MLHRVAETEDTFRKELAEQKANYILETEALKDQTALALELATARVKGLSEALTGTFLKNDLVALAGVKCK